MLLAGIRSANSLMARTWSSEAGMTSAASGYSVPSESLFEFVDQLADQMHVGWLGEVARAQQVFEQQSLENGDPQAAPLRAMVLG